jgi:coenzyme F420-reducing hydrogenase alpha subunit
MVKQIKVDYLARVEGEGALDIQVKDNEIQSLKLRIFEPPRFFQGFLVGRKFDEVPEIVSRICGICPVAHQTTAIMALEDAMGIKVSRQTKDLRKLLVLSQYIQSHTLHIYMLAAPDFLGYESVLAMVPDYTPVVTRALKLKRLGNDLTTCIGGREVHPVTAMVNGFTKVPTKEDLTGFKKKLLAAKEDALETVKLVNSFPIPDFIRECEHVALSEKNIYAINEGNLVSTIGMNISPWQYRNHIKEKQEAYSSALHSYVVGRDSFMVGPLPRVNINFDLLSADAKKAAAETGISFPNFNPFYSALARAIELVDAIDQSMEIIDKLDPKEEDTGFEIKGGQGFALTEAPRGTLYHSYTINEQGIVEEADIVSPTAHNVNNMEQDLWEFVPRVLDLPHEEATLKCEMVIRNYDPCISCSTHFLKLDINQV